MTKKMLLVEEISKQTVDEISTLNEQMREINNIVKLITDIANQTNLLALNAAAVFGLEMHKALRRGRIVIDHRGHHALIATNGSDKEDIGGEDTINMRMFEATAGESLLITDALQGLIRYFEPEREIVTYKDSDDAVQKILYYLKNDAERIKIAKAGKARCFRDHNMYNRANAFARLVLDELSAK
ncbi:MAG: glycosyltransferase family protein [Bdellovibrionota bacterium]